MIYLSLINAKIIDVPGILSPEFAAKHFYRSFIDVKSANNYLINEFLPDSHPSAGFKELTFACSQKGILLYRWDTSDITPDDIKLIGKHVHTLDWYQLIDKSVDFYQSCLESRGSVHEDSMSDMFVHDHYYLIDLDDLEFSKSNTDFISVYDWVRITRAELFKEIESKLLIQPEENEYNFDDVLSDVNELLKTNILSEDIDKAFENMARQSRFYGLIPYTHLISVIKHALDESVPKPFSKIVRKKI